MSIFRDRYVLKDIVIPPEWVRIYAPFYGYVEYARPDTGLQPSPIHTIHFSECRTDRATGEVAHISAEFQEMQGVFENDIFNDGAIVCWGVEEGQWMVNCAGVMHPLSLYLVNPYANPQPYITGMVPWEAT